MKLFTIIFDKNPAFSETKLLGTDGLTDVELVRDSYLFLAGNNPKLNGGFISGWISQDKGSGIVSSNFFNEVLKIIPKLDFGKIYPSNEEYIVSEWFAFGVMKSPTIGLEEYAEQIKQYYKISLPPIPKGGYCTWYAEHHHGAGDEVSTSKLAKFTKENHLIDAGFQVFQIDDMWQKGTIRTKNIGKKWKKYPMLTKRTKKDSGPFNDFTGHRKTGDYPKGMMFTAQNLQNNGLIPGIWLMPFAWDPLCQSLIDHHDWFVKNPKGKIYKVFWAGCCLDMTNPKAQIFLSEVINRITSEWGYEYLKLDGLWSGMATKIRYPEPTFGPDNYGDAIFYDKSKTNLEAYRLGLKIVRDSAKDGTYLLGCNIAQNFRTLGGSMGLVDAMRIGRDIVAKWDAIIPCIEMGSRLYFMHNRVWHNDPDCLMLRSPLTLGEARAWASWIVITGQLNIVSEWLPRLDEDRQEIFRRTIPNTELCGRPLDLFQNDPPCIWYMSKPESNNIKRQDLIGVFNLIPTHSSIQTIKMEEIFDEYKKVSEFIGYEFWSNKFIGPFKNELVVELPLVSSKIFSIKPIKEYPQIISTSRHISQGIVDIISII